MNNIEILYKQIDNQKYVKENLGKEMWVQVSGRKQLNSADVGVWSCLIPLDQVKKSLTFASWDSNTGTQSPSFEDSFSYNYDRFGFTGDKYENIVNYRTFYELKPDYVEIVEEFRLLNNLYYDNKYNKFYEVLENGDCEEVAKIENNTCAYVKLNYLIRYATAKQMALCLFFDMHFEIEGSLGENELEKFEQQFKNENTYYEVWGGNYDFGDKKCFSRLMGKKIIMPKNIESCGYWPFEKEMVYEKFIIGMDENGEIKKFTSDPNKLANYFGKNKGAPHYLTPVFFKKDVLQKYYLKPDCYKVEDGFIKCGSLWWLPIDNDHVDYVSVYLGDLGKKLPIIEQKHWLSYNVLTDEKLSSAAFKRDFCCIASEPDMPDLQFKNKFKTFNNNWNKKYGWDLFIELNKNDAYNIQNLRIPLSDSQEEFDQQVLSIVKVMIDSINEKEIGKQINNVNCGDGGISKLQEWLKEQNVKNSEIHISFLRNLQNLRSTGTAHRKGKKYQKISYFFHIDDKSKKEVFCDILNSALSFLEFLDNSFLG